MHVPNPNRLLQRSESAGRSLSSVCSVAEEDVSWPLPPCCCLPIYLLGCFAGSVQVISTAAHRMAADEGRVLLGLATLTAGHVAVIMGHRVYEVSVNKRKPSSFSKSRDGGETTVLDRVGKSHINCLENLAPVATVLLVNKCFGVANLGLLARLYFGMYHRLVCFVNCRNKTRKTERRGQKWERRVWCVCVGGVMGATVRPESKEDK